MSYKRIHKTAFHANANSSLVKRLEYAKAMLPILASGRRVINIDESTIPFLDFRNHKWGQIGMKNTRSSKDLAPKVNMIAALDTEGRIYIALTQTNTDTDVMTTFLTRLAMVLTAEDKEWRRNTVLLLDGAKYHTCAATKATLKSLCCDYMISAPYSYDAAPIELFFGYFKQAQLNPTNEKTGKR